MLINDLDNYYIVFDTKNRNTELDALIIKSFIIFYQLKEWHISNTINS